jgi:DNA-binding beta-propeller fold protein YncE
VVATVVTGSEPSAVSFAAGAVWVANKFSGDVSRIDPRRNTVKSFHVGGRPASLATGKEAVWVARGPLAQHRGGTLRLLSTGRFVSLDPGFSFQAAPFQWLGLSNDTWLLSSTSAARTVSTGSRPGGAPCRRFRWRAFIEGGSVLDGRAPRTRFSSRL